MRFDRLIPDRLRLFKLLNMAVLLTALIAGIAISSAAGKYLAKDVFYLAPKVNDNAYYLRAEELEELQAACKPIAVATLSLGSGTVSHANVSAYTKIIYTESACFTLNNVRFTAGAGWPANRESDNLIVINQSLAWQLFGSMDAMDKSVTLGGKIYTVAGVTAQEQISRDTCLAYLPSATLATPPGISAVFIQVDNYNKLGSHLQVNDWLDAIHKDSRDYFLTDINRYAESIGLKYQLLLLAISLYVIAVLIITSYALAKQQRARQQASGRFAVILGIIVVLNALFIVALLRGVAPDIWVPHGTGGRLNAIIGHITNSGLLPSAEYLLPNLAAIARLNAYANAALICGLAALVNFMFVHKPALNANKGETAYGQHNLKKRLQNLSQRFYRGKRG